MVRVTDVPFKFDGDSIQTAAFPTLILGDRQREALEDAGEAIREHIATDGETIEGQIHISGRTARITWRDPDGENHSKGPDVVTPEAR